MSPTRSGLGAVSSNQVGGLEKVHVRYAGSDTRQGPKHMLFSMHQTARRRVVAEEWQVCAVCGSFVVPWSGDEMTTQTDQTRPEAGTPSRAPDSEGSVLAGTT